MSTTLNEYLRRIVEGEEILPEMRPDRIAGGRLILVKFGVQLNGTADGCLGTSSAEKSSVSSAVSKKLDTAAAKRLLRWMADSLDTDSPNLEIEVVADDGNSHNVQLAAQHLSEKAAA